MKSGETSLHRLKELVERVETRHQLVARATSAQVALDDALRGSDDGSSVAEAAAQYRGACEKLATDRVWPMVLAVPLLDVEATALSTRPLADVPVLDATTRYARALRFLITAQR